mmetsp:Transcript_13145/g.24228  ORF Transcript_13145/g.24228 Transcript_13145/m.24228 type:complete len:342 (-) Transcript_13145:87-1112(-)
MAAKDAALNEKRTSAMPSARFVAPCRMFCNKKLYDKSVRVAIYDGALAVLLNGHLMDQVVDIQGGTAYIQGLGIAVWVGEESVARLWLEESADLDKFVAAFTAAVAVDQSKGCASALRLEMKAQKRAERWRGCAAGIAHRLGRCQTAICGSQPSATGLMQDSYQPAGGRKRSSKEKVSGTFSDDQLQGYLGTVGFYHKSLGRYRTTCSVSLHGDVLVAVPLDRYHKSVSIILHGTTINLAQKLVGIWKDSVLIGRLWFTNESDAARWAGLLDAATRLLAGAVAAADYGKKRAVTILPPPKSADQGAVKGEPATGRSAGSLRGRLYVSASDANLNVDTATGA